MRMLPAGQQGQGDRGGAPHNSFRRPAYRAAQVRTFHGRRQSVEPLLRMPQQVPQTFQRPFGKPDELLHEEDKAGQEQVRQDEMPDKHRRHCHGHDDQGINVRRKKTVKERLKPND